VASRRVPSTEGPEAARSQRTESWFGSPGFGDDRGTLELVADPVTLLTARPRRPPRRPRWWRYLALGGVAIGVGFGVGALVSPPSRSPGPVNARAVGHPRPDAAAVRATAVPPAAGPADARLEGGGAEPTSPPAPTDTGRLPGDEPGVSHAMIARGTVQQLVAAQRAALARADGVALAGLLIPTVFGFGVDAAEVAEGRDAVAAQLVHDLGEPPAGGFTVRSRALAIGGQHNTAWIAEELEIAAAGRAPRRLAITQLAALRDGQWSVVVLHWAAPVEDAIAERLAVQNSLPPPRPIADRRDGSDELDRAAHAAFASRAAFAEARSLRPDAFNVGSGGERARGGAVIKRLFGKLKAQIRIRGGARVVDGSAWDPAQRTDAWIGWAAVNVDFVTKIRAATEVTQTMRVLAIWLKDESGWKIVQTQWSNGGPIH